MKMIRVIFFLIFYVAAVANSFLCSASKEYSGYKSNKDDQIVKLPGQPDGVDFDQYAGYVTVDQNAGRALFYYFAEATEDSTSNRSSKPLVLWLNGGPGCSSLGYGAMEELGPFRVASDGRTLYRNPYAWNKVANVLFLESPVGVGFSYSNTTDDYFDGNDNRTAADAYTFLINWMERFPKYKGRDFYITGESYAGHYVPQLANVILNSPRYSSIFINLKGIMIGNPDINEKTDKKGRYDYWWTHALISDSTIEKIHKNCNFSSAAPMMTDDCKNTEIEADNMVYSNLNVYNIYTSRCSSYSLTTKPKPYSIEKFDPCEDAYVVAYLNDGVVQRALHANVTKLADAWSACNGIFNYKRASTVLPIIKKLISNKIRVWVYSGDVDGQVPITSTKYSLNQLKLSIVRPWKAWFINNEVGGFSMVYEKNLTFVTVRGAGHQVPSYKPAHAFELIKSFLQGTSLS